MGDRSASRLSRMMLELSLLTSALGLGLTKSKYSGVRSDYDLDDSENKHAIRRRLDSLETGDTFKLPAVAMSWGNKKWARFNELVDLKYSRAQAFYIVEDHKGKIPENFNKEANTQV